jgi:hypothetical protein
MQVARWVRQHFQLVKLGPRVVDLGFERAIGGPFFLPLVFYLFGKVFLVHKTFKKSKSLRTKMFAFDKNVSLADIKPCIHRA